MVTALAIAGHVIGADIRVNTHGRPLDDWVKGPKSPKLKFSLMLMRSLGIYGERF